MQFSPIYRISGMITILYSSSKAYLVKTKTYKYTISHKNGAMFSTTKQQHFLWLTV